MKKSHEKVMRKSWESHEKVIIKSRKFYAKVMNKYWVSSYSIWNSPNQNVHVWLLGGVKILWFVYTNVVKNVANMLWLLLEIGLVEVLHKESKPRGRGVSQMSALLYTNPYIVKWSTKGEGKGG